MGIVVVAVAGVFGALWAWLAVGVLLVVGVGGLAWGVLRERRTDSVASMGSSIRPIALGLIRRRDQILVFEGRDDVKGETYYRPLGGGVEFGERSDDALVREFREELDAEIVVKERLGVLENVFAWRGNPGHEIAFIYEAEFVDPELYARDAMKILDDPATAGWVDLRDFRDGGKILYPHGLTELLSSEH
ncbi:NUDIX hydrolase [Amycolatopsis mongoliensis]|uniref:NUDIX hydrolase n=1 Tax=Amycolatopsis mongoliensis TaxID=715475 RepID=A0A9Y2K0E8_9PSEU|nr:NUDIX hydrolase [Amycolatopsis sp. 4-36]WIY06966.1 NUDIX hydrolase [Amycolatopsis sp. 4-36]